MCSLETEPWRKDFTGPLCRCGVPTPGTAEERRIDDEHRKASRFKYIANLRKEMYERYQNRKRDILK